MCCLNEVSSIASTNYAFVAITDKGNIVPWGDAGCGGVFNNDHARQKLNDGVTKVNLRHFFFDLKIFLGFPQNSWIFVTLLKFCNNYTDISISFQILVKICLQN